MPKTRTANIVKGAIRSGTIIEKVYPVEPSPDSTAGFWIAILGLEGSDKVNSAMKGLEFGRQLGGSLRLTVPLEPTLAKGIGVRTKNSTDTEALASLV